MKIVESIKKFLIGVLGVVFFVFVISVTLLLLNYNKYGVTQFGDTSLILIRGDLSSEKYTKGDLVIVETKKIDKIVPGDEMFAYKLAGDGSVSIDLGLVGETHPDDNAISYENGSIYTMDFVAGEATKVYNKIGGYLSIIQSKWGFLFIVLVPSFLIFIYEFYALIIEIKYGKEDYAAQKTN